MNGAKVSVQKCESSKTVRKIKQNIDNPSPSFLLFPVAALCLLHWWRLKLRESKGKLRRHSLQTQMQARSNSFEHYAGILLCYHICEVADFQQTSCCLFGRNALWHFHCIFFPPLSSFSFAYWSALLSG